MSEVLGRGWGYASLNYGEIQPDRADRWKEGVIGLALKEGQARPAPDEWGTISAWAWGISRVIDFLETEKRVDARRIAIPAIRVWARPSCGPEPRTSAWPPCSPWSPAKWGRP